MSIIICNLCEHQIDSDFVDCNEYEGKEVCQECFESEIDYIKRTTEI